jgi:hypothetical protein
MAQILPYAVITPPCRISKLGVLSLAVSMWIGPFAMRMGLWIINRIVKERDDLPNAKYIAILLMTSTVVCGTSLLLGVAALRRINRSDGALTGRPFAYAGITLTLGWFLFYSMMLLNPIIFGE